MNAIEKLNALREQKQARMDELNTLADDEGRTKSDAEREEHDTLVADIKGIDREISDREEADRLAKRAKPAEGSGTDKAAGSRSTGVVVTDRAKKLEPGIQFARLAMCLAKAKGNPQVAHTLLQLHYPEHPGAVGLKMAAERGEEYGNFMGMLQTKESAAVDGGTTATGSWAAALLAHNTFSGDFIDFLRARTIIGQMGQGNIPSFRRIPFNVNIKGQDLGSTGGWTGQGQPKPVTKGRYTSAYHGFKKATAISVISDELIRFSDPSAEALVRDDLAAAVIAVLDGSLVDDTAVSSARPAGLLDGVSGTASSGTDHAAIKADLKVLWAAAIAANQPIEGAVYLTTPAIAQALSLMHGELSDAPLFPNITLRGGSLLGVPVLVSNYVPAGNFILVFAPEVYLSDDGMVTVDASREATIEMETEPEAAISDLDGTTPVPVDAHTGSALVSMFQTNSVALRAERYVNWSKRRTTAVDRITGVEWGTEGS